MSFSPVVVTVPLPCSILDLEKAIEAATKIFYPDMSRVEVTAELDIDGREWFRFSLRTEEW